MNQPLVSVICLCFNHERFIREALESVISQTYQNIEIIIVDDASSDRSKEVIKKMVTEFPFIRSLDLKENVGNCKAFNQGFALSKGDYIVDFATDDVMMPDRIAGQVNQFQKLDQSYGVVFSNSEYIDENGGFLGIHYDILFKRKVIQSIPEGDVFTKVIDTYFISSPTMMYKREVLNTLNGYDESLAYEDFDFWVRSARIYKYAFLNQITTRVRKVKGSMSSGWYVPGDKQLHSSYLVCRKIKDLIRKEEENLALIKRVRYELRQSVFSENVVEARLFYQLLHEINGLNLVSRCLAIINAFGLPLSFFRRMYYTIVYSPKHS